MPKIIPTTLRFKAKDGWDLEASLWTGPDPKIGVMISAGTGFPRQFYAPIASYLAAQGAIVLTFDYRGIGGSNTNADAFLDIDYPDWGRFDMSAALDLLKSEAPDLPITHLAHSVGGHFVGLMPNHHQIDRHAFISVGTGYFGGHHLKYVPMEIYFWWVLGTFSLLRHGYIKPVGGWQGEPLPPKLFKTWRRWSHRKAYLEPDMESYLAPQHYTEVTAPIRSWIFTDDPIATKQAATDILSYYRSAPSELVVRSPSDIGVKRIGHDGAFRKGRESLWSEIWTWLAA